MFDVTRWWYKRGVSGFRLDAVDTLFEDPSLHDNPVLPGKSVLGDPNEENKYNDKLPEVHEALKGLRKVADEYDAVLIGETWTYNIAELKQYYGHGNNELQMPMDLMLTKSTIFGARFPRAHSAVDSLRRMARRSSSAITTSCVPGTATATASTTIRSPRTWRRCT